MKANRNHASKVFTQMARVAPDSPFTVLSTKNYVIINQNQDHLIHPELTRDKIIAEIINEEEPEDPEEEETPQPLRAGWNQALKFVMKAHAHDPKLMGPVVAALTNPDFTKLLPPLREHSGPICSP